MDLKTTSILASHYPMNRRRNHSNIEDALKDIGSSFITLIENSTNIHHRQSLKDSQTAIKQHYKKIHELIDSIDEHITRKLQYHQNQVFSLVRGEIQEMREETREMVQKLNRVIKEKNTEDSLWEMGNELDYFKAQTFKLFQQNKKIRKESQVLKKQIKEFRIQIQHNDLVMQKLKKKQIKAESLMKKSYDVQKHTKTKTQFLSTEPILQPLVKQPSLKRAITTEPSEQKLIIKKQSIKLNQQSIININLQANKSKYLPKIADDFQFDPLDDFSDIPLDVLEQRKNSLQMPPAKIVQIDSSYIEEEDSYSQVRKNEKIDRSMQTQQFATTEPQFISKNDLNIHSMTSYFEHHPDNKRQKQIDLIKNGFFIKGYNQKSKTMTSPMTTPSPPPLVKDQNHYISKVFQNNKIQAMTGKIKNKRSVTIK